MRHTFKHAFTMIEIMIALGITAIGVCSIMVLFPIGANANRDAAMETYAANAADELLHYIKWEATANNAANWDTTFNNIVEYSNIPKEADDTPSYQTVRYEDKSAWTRPLASSNNVIQHGTQNSLYLLVNANATIGSAWSAVNEADIEDTAIIYVWKEQTTIDTVPIPYPFAATLHAEVSWPATLPYAARKKSTFVFDIFKP